MTVPVQTVWAAEDMVTDKKVRNNNNLLIYGACKDTKKLYICNTMLKVIISLLAMVLAFAPVPGFIKYEKGVRLPPPAVYDTVRVCVLGDLMMHSAQIEAAKRGNGAFDFRPSLDSIRQYISAADLCIANMEFTLGGAPYSGYPAFSAPDSFASYAADCGVDVFLTANNHIMDRGRAGLERTFGVYASMEGVTHARINPTIVRAGPIRLALVNCTYGTNAPRGSLPDSLRIPLLSERDSLAAAFKRAKASRADFVLAFPHWGEEYKLVHNAAQEEAARFFVEAGADAVIGAHPHCVQDSARVAGVPIFYSVGNALSNMSAANTQLELMVTLRFVRGRDFTLHMLDPEYDWLWCSRPGGLNGGYCVIRVKDYVGRRAEWRNPADYDKMMATLSRILEKTNLQGIPFGKP